LMVSLLAAATLVVCPPGSTFLSTAAGSVQDCTLQTFFTSLAFESAIAPNNSLDGATVDVKKRGITKVALLSETSGFGQSGKKETEGVAAKYGITRQECDELAVISHNRAVASIEAGVFKREIVPVELKSKKGSTFFEVDENPIRDATVASIGKLPTVFRKDGVVTAANASSINDGASAVVVMSLDKARELGLKPLAKLVGICNAGIDAMVMGLGPAVAIPKCLKQAGLSFNDIEYWEVNEAFAAQWLGVGRMLKEEHNVSLSTENCNFNGSGIALGHPVGSTGLRIVVSLCYELERQGKTLGGASLCVGTGPAMASLWSRDI